ncbi:MAG: response regulator transcription factor [Proteobacteria bacterium]|nr:response regulator transcription factor [Pseudomonadota bacterium]
MYFLDEAHKSYSLKHVLVVDDDYDIRRLLAKILSINGYAVSTAVDTTEAEALLGEFKFDVVIMDALMPKEDGLSFLKRYTINAPVIMLTALGGVDDRIAGLEQGAEDYIAKPFEPKELLLRIQKVIRRKSENNDNHRFVKFGDFVFDLKQRSLKNAHNTVYLTDSERKLLSIFATRAGQIVARTEILEASSDMVNARTIDTQIARLRCKIEKDAKRAEYLQTIRGVGYTLWATPRTRA